MNNFLKNLLEITHQLLSTGWQKVRSALAGAEVGDLGSSPAAMVQGNESHSKSGLISHRRKTIRLIALLVFAGVLSGSIWKIVARDRSVVPVETIDWLTEYRALVTKIDRNELPAQSDLTFSKTAVQPILRSRLESHLQGRMEFTQTLSYPISVEEFLPIDTISHLSSAEKNAYIDALLGEWSGFVFSGDVDVAAAYSKNFEVAHQALGASTEQQLKIANLGLRTIMLSGKAASREQLATFAAGIEKSTTQSLYTDAATLRLALVDANVRAGRYSEVNKLLDEVMVVARAGTTPDGASIRAVRRPLADAAMLVGRFADSRVALQVFQEVEDELQTCHDRVEYWLSQAELTLNEGRAKQAEFSIAQAGRCFEAKKALDHFQFARMKNTEGLLHLLMGRPAEALSAFGVAEEIWKAKLGEQHFWLGHAYNNKGAALRMRGDLPSARQELEKAASLWREVLGESHPLMATYFNNIAELEMGQGELGKSQESFVNARYLRRLAFGDEHPWTAVVISNLGEVASLDGAYDRALAFHVKALSIRKKIFGDFHPDTALSQNNHGSILFRMGETRQALIAFQEALTIDQKLLGDAHPRSLDVLANLAAAQVALEDYASAEGTLVRLSDLEASHGDVAKASVAMILARLGDVRLKLRLLTDAEAAYLAALEALNQIERDHHSAVTARKAQSGLAVVRRQLGKASARPPIESLYPWLVDLQ